MDRCEFLRCTERSPMAMGGRTIDKLPARSEAKFYTPNRQLDFDDLVRDYCLDGRNHIAFNGVEKSSTRRHSTTTTYTQERAPFSRVSRSVKVILSGDVGVGKTSLVSRFGRGSSVGETSALGHHQTTVGVDFDIQRFRVLEQPLSLQIWDTAGLERFRCITSSYYRNCHAALLVFDLSQIASLASVLRWRDQVLEGALPADDKNGTTTTTTTNQQAPLLFLVGSKSDLPMSQVHREFMEEQANKIASLIGAELWFVSAQSGLHVGELFKRLAGLTFERLIKREICLNELLLAQKQDKRHSIGLLEFSSKSSKLSPLEALEKSTTTQTQTTTNRLIKVTRKRKGDERRSRCVNVQFTC